MLGERRTYVDACVLPMLRWARALVPGALDARPNCRALLERLEGDPAVRKVLADEGLDASKAA
jgi:glutathione S-transferase